MEIRIHLEKDEEGAWVATCPSLLSSPARGEEKGDFLLGG